MRVLAYNKATSWFGHRLCLLRPLLARPLLYQGLLGLLIFFSLGCLYGLGSWLASQNPTLLDVKTTQEGFLEVSKILGDPRTTTHPPMILPSYVTITKDIYASKWIRKVNVCQQKKSLSLLVTVISAPHKTEERNAIRRGWGKTASKLKNVAFAFIVGKPSLSSKNGLEDVLAESDKFQDMILIDHLDTYNNLTLKTLAAFDYLLSTCPQAQYLLKTDDDMFIQVKRLLALIRGLNTSKDLQEIIVGNVASGWVPVRNPQSKYFITEEQYSEATYPPFVTGPSYLVSKTAVNHLFEAALEHPFLHLEDVFLTGIIAEQVGIPRRLAIEFRNNAVRIPAQFLGCTLLRTISIHKVLATEQEKLSQMAKNPQCGSGSKKKLEQ